MSVLYVRDKNGKPISVPYVNGGSSGIAEKDVMCVNINGNESAGYTADKTTGEIHEAFLAGKDVFCKVYNMDGSYSLPLVSSHPGLSLFGVIYEGDTLTVKISNSDGVEFAANGVMTYSDVREMQTWAENMVDEKLREFEGGSGGNVDQSGLTDEIKFALLNCFKNVAWAVDNGMEYYNTLYNLLIEVYFVQSGDTLTMYGVQTVDTIQQNDTALVLA